MVKSSQIIAFILTISCFFMVSSSYAIELRFPVACQLMTNCWITDHVDLNKAADKHEDYMCGSKASDGNLSTHISLGHFDAVDQTMPVIAAANGTIDVAQDIGGFCGVRVLIAHEKGWQTSYCHLNPDTLQVHTGQTVVAGQIIGSIGMSGQTKWPHLSFAVTRNDMVFDPFSGRTPLEGCLPTSKPLWIGGINPLYEPAHVTSIGFTVGAATNKDILSGKQQTAQQIATITPQLSLWGLMMNVEKDDDIHMEITTPSGRILNETHYNADKNYNFYPVYFSTLRRQYLWEAGQYTGKITITRRVNGHKITVGKRAFVDLKDVQ